METSGRPLIFPTRAQTVELNQKHLARTGGHNTGGENLSNGNSLEWVLYTMQHPFVFDENQYPTIAHLAGILAWTIIDNHVFGDGNKRTGISAMEVFLRVNGYALLATNDELEEVALKIGDKANTGFTFEEFVQWLTEYLHL